ncbi:4-hydroxy-tetrahydrodipicolinate reductase [Bienertia sinuspersici]
MENSADSFFLAYILEYYVRMEESSGSGGNTMGGRGKNKRFWSAEEDKALVAALHELSVDPHWKCDIGFRNGYMVRLEELIGKAMPGCGLKASPHIDSRLKTLVSKFRAILLMLGTSGFKWDDQRHMISIERSAHDEFCKVRKLYLLMATMNTHLSTMANVWVRADEREQELTDKNNKVLGELLQLDDLSPTEALEAANILTTQPHKLTVFFNCPPLLNMSRVFLDELMLVVLSECG